MGKPTNGFEFLEELKKQNGKQMQNFSDLSRYLAFKSREQGIPYSGQFELTPLCNFNCKMCYVHLDAEQLNGRDILPVEVWKDLMYQAWNAGMCHANLTGGECLAYSGFEELFLYLHSLGVQVGVLTNGYLLNDQWIHFFQQHMPSRIQITLYGWNDEVYERVTGKRAFNTVYMNVKKAIESGLPVSLSVTPNSFLGEDVLETIRIGKETCRSFIINSSLFSPREETGRSSQQASSGDELYLRIYRLRNELDGVETKEIDASKLPPCGGLYHSCEKCGVRCGGGRAAFVIDWKGIMMPCNRLDMIHADALNEGILSAWKKINLVANNWPRVPECEGCPYDEVCNNCAANMLQYAEPGKRPIALCEQTRFFVQHGIGHVQDCN